MSQAVIPTSSTYRTVPGVPAWVRRAAHAAAWANVPSGLWRLGLAVGIPFGLAQSELDNLQTPGWGSLYLIVLTVMAEVLGLLTLGLIQPWGETWPRWIPILGGRDVPVRPVAMVAGLGALTLTVYGALFVYTSFSAEVEGARWAAWLINAVYAPLVLWGPLLGLVTLHYYRRRRSAGSRA